MDTKTNSYHMSEDSFVGMLSKRGVRGISGQTFGDEATHNSHDAKATSQFLCFDKNVLMWGNNGDPLYWDDFESSYLKYKRPGRTAAKTGYWGVGGSKFLPYCDGLPNYQLTTYDGKYFKRVLRK